MERRFLGKGVKKIQIQPMKVTGRATDQAMIPGYHGFRNTHGRSASHVRNEAIQHLHVAFVPRRPSKARTRDGPVGCAACTRTKHSWPAS
eukprot:scaffold3667_cov180-Amphora_coffeaeformis.AAC.14